jgi:hypothetical protein
MKINSVGLNLNCQVGTLVRIDDEGRPLVSFPGSPGQPVVARVAFSGNSTDFVEGAPVLLVFENGDESRPLVLGPVRESCQPAETSPPIEVGSSVRDEVILDRRRIRFCAGDQVVVQCGRGSITLNADGSLEIRATRIVSQSSGVHKIRGATVRIN